MHFHIDGNSGLNLQYLMKGQSIDVMQFNLPQMAYLLCFEDDSINDNIYEL